MCNYSRNPSSPALPSVGCSGVQNGTFAAGAYGFASDVYWSSSQFFDPGYVDYAWRQSLASGVADNEWKGDPLMRVRPVRAF